MESFILYLGKIFSKYTMKTIFLMNIYSQQKLIFIKDMLRQKAKSAQTTLKKYLGSSLGNKQKERGQKICNLNRKDKIFSISQFFLSIFFFWILKNYLLAIFSLCSIKKIIII